MQASRGMQPNDVVIDRDVKVPMRDETHMACNIYYPAVDGKKSEGAFPVILERTPYDKNRHFLHLTGQFFARFGYVFVIQDVRGRYGSDGEFFFIFNEKDEGRDGYDTIEWIGSQSWCNGKVGTTGLSFTGMNQQTLAVLNPPYLASQFIIDCGLNYWERPLRQNGAFAMGIMLPYVFRMARHGKEASQNPSLGQLLDRDFREVYRYLEHLPLKKGATTLAHASSYEGWYLGMATHGDYDEFWQQPSATVEGRLDQWKDVPICFVTGWYAHHLTASIEKYRYLTERHSSPVRVVVGPWLHSYDDMVSATWAGDVDFGPGASLGELNVSRLRWFNETLRGEETGAAENSSIHYYTLGGGSGLTDASWRMQHGGQGWSTTTVWPPQGVTETNYYLHPDGLLAPEAPLADNDSSSFTYDPKNPVPTIGGSFQNPGVPGFIAGGAFDQRGQPKKFASSKDSIPLSFRQDVLVFQTPALEKSVEITGEITVKFFVSSSCVDTDFTVKLVDVYPPNVDYPEGFAMNLTDSIVRMRYRNGRRTAEIIEPDEIYEVEILLHSISNVFQQGHHIRLDVSSSNFPFYDVNPNSGGPQGMPGPMQIATNTVHHDVFRPSHVTLPIK